MSSTPVLDRCDQLEQASIYAMHALPPAEASAFEAHTLECRQCREELQQLRPVVNALSHWPTDILRPSESLWERLVQRISAQEGTQENASEWQEPSWEEVAAGISCKLLSTDSQRNRVSMLVRLAPGVDYPPHRHAGVEKLYLLHGELWIDDRKLHPGDYNRAEPGSVDKRVWSETGCTCVLITSADDILR